MGDESDELKQIAKAFSSFDSSRDALKEFLETKPLYGKLRVALPDHLARIYPDGLILNCSTCKAERPFQNMRSGGSGVGLPSSPKRVSGTHYFRYACTGCKQETFECWVYADFKEEWIQKVGQLPMWLPVIPKEIKTELGEDAELYQKALRNLNEGYGIGACAYLRRLLETYINPLLQLLHDAKKETGADEEELKAILDAISSKDFTSKTRFAADVAPPSILVEGHNPLKEIHERLSVGLHTLDEATATKYAQKIINALEFIIRNLRRTHNERRAYATQIKEIRDLPTK